MPFDPSCIDVMDYLECMDIQNAEQATEKEIRFSCPLPAHAGGDESPSAYMNVQTTAFFCHSCHAKGNAVTLASIVLGVSPIQATRLLKQRYSPAGINPDSRNMVEEIRAMIMARQGPEKRQNKRLDESALDHFKRNWDYDDMKTEYGMYLHRRGFRRAELESWQFGYHPEKNRVTLPIRDEEGFLVGFKARALDDRKPKYLNLRDDDREIEPFLKNEVVFALDRAKLDPRTRDWLVLVEGEWNAIAMHEFHNFRNTVAINGSYFGETQMKLIKRFTDCVLLFFDTDRAGIDATIAVTDALKPFVDVRICPDHHGDPMVMHPYSVERCIREARSVRQLQLARS